MVNWRTVGQRNLIPERNGALLKSTSTCTRKPAANVDVITEGILPHVNAGSIHDRWAQRLVVPSVLNIAKHGCRLPFEGYRNERIGCSPTAHPPPTPLLSNSCSAASIATATPAIAPRQNSTGSPTSNTRRISPHSFSALAPLRPLFVSDRESCPPSGSGRP